MDMATHTSIAEGNGATGGRRKIRRLTVLRASYRAGSCTVACLAGAGAKRDHRARGNDAPAWPVPCKTVNLTEKRLSGIMTMMVN